MVVFLFMLFLFRSPFTHSQRRIHVASLAFIHRITTPFHSVFHLSNFLNKTLNKYVESFIVEDEKAHTYIFDIMKNRKNKKRKNNIIERRKKVLPKHQVSAFYLFFSSLLKALKLIHHFQSELNIYTHNDVELM